MGKIKSAVITAILVAAIVVLTFFATVSYMVPGSNGVKRYNSFISNISLGADLSGEAVAVLYPDGVISAADYKLLTDDEDKLTEYEEKYAPYGSVYVEKDKITEYGEDAFKEMVENDAAVLTKRLGQKGYSRFSVSVQDDFTVKVAVPSNFSYAAYKKYDTTTRTRATSAIEQTLKFMFYSGELTLRNSNAGNPSADNILTPIADDITTYFKSITKYSMAGNYAVKLNLTKAGREIFKSITKKITDAAESDDDDKAIGFYVGDDQLLSLTVSGEIDSSSFFISIENGGEATAQDYAIVLNSDAHGEVLSLDYNTDDFDVVYASPSLGAYAPVFLACAMLVIILAAIIYSIIKYKKLGLVNAIMILIYSLAIIVALTVIGIQFTIAGAVTVSLGLLLLCCSNFALFEEVRKETKKGKTMQSAIKSAYKNLLTGILELHVILLVAAILLALVCVGEIASCGLIFLIATIISYVLYWFTRFMWYVTSSNAKDKFRFGGFTREEYIDD